MNTPRSDKAWKAFKESSNAQHIRSESCRLETELVEVTKERDAIKLRNDTLETENAVRRADSYADQKAAREAMDERDGLKANIERMQNIADSLLNHCDKEGGECSECGKIVCPHGEPLHFHHDGCPACAQHESGEPK